MVKLTPLGKMLIGVVGLIIVIIIGFTVFTALSSTGNNVSTEVVGEGNLKIQIYVSSFDQESVTMVEHIRDIAEEKEFQGIYSYEIINIHKDAGKAQQAGVVDTPTIAFDGEKFTGIQTKDWIKDKILEKIS